MQATPLRLYPFPLIFVGINSGKHFHMQITRVAEAPETEISYFTAAVPGKEGIPNLSGLLQGVKYNNDEGWYEMASSRNGRRRVPHKNRGVCQKRTSLHDEWGHLNAGLVIIIKQGHQFISRFAPEKGAMPPPPPAAAFSLIAQC